MTRHVIYPEQYRIDTTHRIARELLKELEWLENRQRELACDDPVTSSGVNEHQITCNTLAQRIRRIKDELRGA